MATLRNSKDIIKGSHLMVFMEDGNGDLQPIAFATSHSFSKQLNTQEISCKDFGDVAAVLPQNYSWTIQTDNLYSINGYQAVNNVFKNMTKVLVYFGETDYNQTSTQASIVDVDGAQEWGLSGFGEQGYAYITALDVTASAGENATFSATFTGTGTLEEVENDVKYNITKLCTPVSISSHFIVVNKAESGDTVTISTDQGATYNNEVNTITTSPTTLVTYNSSNNTWSFTMPESDITINISDIANVYNIEKTGYYASNFKVTSTNNRVINRAVSSYTLLIVPFDSESYNDSNYSVVTTPEVSVIWNDASSYWTAVMPSSNLTIGLTPIE